MSNIYVMVGAPGSGKSTYIKNHINANTDKWVSRDQIRFSIVSPEEPYFSKEKEVFRLFINMINIFLAQNYNVWVDATNLNVQSRHKLLSRIKKQNHKCIALVFLSSFNHCLKNNENRAGTRAYVPQKSIENMYDSMVIPSFSEGFNEIKKFYIDDNNNFIKEEVFYDTL